MFVSFSIAQCVNKSKFVGQGGVNEIAAADAALINMVFMVFNDILII